MKSKIVSAAAGTVLCVTLLAACNKEPSSTPAATATPLPTGEAKIDAIPSSFLSDKIAIYSESRAQFPGQGYTPENENYKDLGGRYCVVGARKVDTVPNATRYLLESKVQDFKSGIDNKMWHRHSITLTAMVVKERASLEDPEISEDRASLPADEFLKTCGTRFVSALYSGAVISTTVEYSLSLDDEAPQVVKLVVDDNDEKKLQEMKATFEDLLTKMHAAKSARDFDSLGEQSPALLFFKDQIPKEENTFNRFKLYVKLAAKAKIPSPKELPIIEATPYPAVAK